MSTKSSQSPSSQDSKASGLTAMLLRFALAGAGLLISLVLAEVGTRILWGQQGRSFSPETATAELVKAGTIMQEGMVAPGAEDGSGGDGSDGDGEADGAEPKKANQRFLHPYFGWDTEGPHSPYLEQREMFLKPRSQNVFDVLVLGGSVAANFGWTGRKALFEQLKADPRFENRPLRMFNHGIAGFKQPQQANRLLYLFTYGYSPDLVINLDGFNEVALGNQNAVSEIHPLHPSGTHWSRLTMQSSEAGTSGPAFDAMSQLRHYEIDAAEQVERALELGLHRYALTTELAAWWIRRARAKGLRAYERLATAHTEVETELPIFGPEFEPKTPKVLELCVEGWANASFSIQGMCAARGIDYLHVLQPTLHDPGSKPLTQAEIDSSGCTQAWQNGAEMGYPMLRASGRLLAERGVWFFDASMVFEDVRETLYFDACHFVPEGQEILARAIARDYLARLPEEGPGQPQRSIGAKFLPKKAR